MSGTSETLQADVLIVGGGLVGGTLACALAQHGITVAVIDSEDPGALVEEAYDGRSSAIALACQRVLEQVGIWRHMDSGHQGPGGGVQPRSSTSA